MELHLPRIDSVMNIVVLGGCGHVGLPLGLVLAENEHDVTALDISEKIVKSINSGIPPFLEPEIPELLARQLNLGNFRATLDPAVIKDANIVVVVIGTPVDEHSNPSPLEVVNAVAKIEEYLNDEQVIILRSTVSPGVTRLVINSLRTKGINSPVFFCPERIAEGFAVKELKTLPQIIGSDNTTKEDIVRNLFVSLGVEVLSSSIEEAEFAKLFTNAYRYIKFAAANQFWEMSNEAGVDFENIRKLISYNYPRALDLPRAGFAAGPCLVKDTLQLSYHFANRFSLGNTSLQVNEGLPLYIARSLNERYELKKMSVAVLGMAFKGESDDIRSSLSYKLKKVLMGMAKEVITSDPYVMSDVELVPLVDAINRADLIIIATPHKIYSNLETKKPIFDIWNLSGKGIVI